MSTKRALAVVITFATLVALAGGALNLYIGFSENSMGEFFCGDEINYSYAAEWFLLSSLYYGIFSFAFVFAFFLLVWPFKRR